jgi:hypothetical protein
MLKDEEIRSICVPQGKTIYQIMGKCVSTLRKLLLKIKRDTIKGS